MFRWLGNKKTDADALMREAYALHNAGTLAQAAALYRKILDLQPGNYDALYLLGMIENARGDFERAIALIKDAIRHHGQVSAFHRTLGDILYQLGRWPEAAKYYETALKLGPERKDPELVPVLANLGAIYRSQGRIGASMAEFREALAMAPNETDIFSSYLFTLNLSARLSPDEVYAEHRRYGNLLGTPRRRRATDADASRRIRLGYVSPDFNHHAVSYYIEPVLAQHDATRFDVFCYYLQAQEDETTARLKALSPHWIGCAAYTDEQLEQRIASDRIDILVDLAGHTAGNRLPVFARKPAPVQVTWLGYLNTTGLDAMDYRLTDACADPPGLSERYYAETLVRLPESQWCYRHPGSTPPVSALPAIAAGRICFGSFNKYQKLSGFLLDIWAKLLLQVADARLLFVGVPPEEQRRLADFFAERGIDRGRLVLHDQLPLAQFRDMHRNVDIALDAHPYSGATTTCDSLWMGVPTLTLAGASSISRSTASLMHALGLSDWIARTPEEFVEFGKRNAGQLAELSALRAGLRERLEASSLMDAARFTANLESAYRSMWQAYCALLPATD